MKNKIQNLIKLLLALHKKLMDLERKEYEIKNGPILNNNDYFNIVINHADFKWLRALSEIISIIDEEGEQEEINENRIKDLLNEILKMLTTEQVNASGTSEVTEFSQRYGQVIVQDYDLATMGDELKLAIKAIL